MSEQGDGHSMASRIDTDIFDMCLKSFDNIIIRVVRDHTGRGKRFEWSICVRRDTMLRESNNRIVKGRDMCRIGEGRKTDQHSTPSQ